MKDFCGSEWKGTILEIATDGARNMTWRHTAGVRVMV
jgi:hypothetical protein